MPNPGQLQSLKQLDDYISQQRAKRATFWSQGPAGRRAAPGACHMPAFKAAPGPHRGAASTRTARAACNESRLSCRNRARQAGSRIPAAPLKSSQPVTDSKQGSGVPRVAQTARQPLVTRAALSAGDAVNRQERKYALSTRALSYELVAIKAVDARLEMLDRLALVCERVAHTLAAHHGFLPGSDPLMKLFYTTVAKVRTKTMDAIEAVAAWERCVGEGRAFIHRCARMSSLPIE